MNALRRTAALLATAAALASFSPAHALGGTIGDAVGGVADALKNPNLGAAATRNISDVDTSRADGFGNNQAGDANRANSLLGATGGKSAYLNGKMYDPGNNTDQLGEKGGKNLIVRLARDLKNVLIAIAGFLLLIAVVRLIFSGAEEEEAKKLKTTVVWATIGIVVMQSADAFVTTMFGKPVDQALAQDFTTNVLTPMTSLLEVVASFAFIAAAFYGFYKIITAQGEEDQVKQGKTVFINSAIGFLALQLIKPFVYSLYGQEDCKSADFLGVSVFKNCELKTNVGATVGLVGKILDWANGFVAIVTVLIILYAGFLVLTSGGDEEKIKQAKGTIKYIVVGIILLATTYILFRFFVTQDVPAPAN